MLDLKVFFINIVFNIPNVNSTFFFFKRFWRQPETQAEAETHQMEKRSDIYLQRKI